MSICTEYGKETMELMHFFTLDPKAIDKRIGLGRIENLNENGNNLQSLGILINSKQLGGLGGRLSVWSVLSGNVSSFPCGLGS